MARRAVPKNNLSKGVLDPLLRERTDLEQYFQGMLDATNAIVLPQGGVRQRGGLRHRARLRYRIRRLDIPAASITAPNGGTAANAVDQNTATEFRTTTAVTGNPFVVVSAALGSSQSIAFVDLIQLSSKTRQRRRCAAGADVGGWLDLGGSWPPAQSSHDGSHAPLRDGAGVLRARRRMCVS